MKKMYVNPKTEIINITVQQQMLAGSGGVADGGKVGNSYNASDESYSRGGLWDDDED